MKGVSTRVLLPHLFVGHVNQGVVVAGGGHELGRIVIGPAPRDLHPHNLMPSLLMVRSSQSKSKYDARDAWITLIAFPHAPSDRVLLFG